MVLVDIRETTSAQGSGHLPADSARQRLRAGTTLRALIKGQPVDPERVAETGLSLETIQDLVDRMKRAKFGGIFFGMGLSMTRGKHMNSAAHSQRSRPK